MNEIKLIIKGAKYLLPLFTLISLCKLVLYYSMFNINIGEYILVEEYLSPFIKDILLYLIFFLIPLLITIIFFGDAIGRWNYENHKKIAELPFKQRLWNDLKSSWFMWIIYIVCIIYYIVKKSPMELYLAGITLYPLLSLSYWIRREFMIKHNVSLQGDNPALINLILWVVSIFIMTISGTFTNVYFVKYGKDQTRVVCNNDTINFRDSLGYIGRTKDFTFIYNKKTKESIILSNKEIKEVITK